MKTALQIAKNRTAKYTKAKVHARAQKPKKWIDPRPANCSGDNPSLLKKRAGWKLTREKSIKRSHWEERKQPYSPSAEQNRTI